MGLLKVIRKLFLYLIFGAGSLVIGLVILPLERLLIHPVERFRRAGRVTITYSHRLFVLLTSILGLLRIDHSKLDVSDLKGKIVAPNHPSLLDVVILFSLIPGANCIVRGGLVKSVVGFIVRALYIPNDGDFEELKRRCCKSLESGDTLIIFPEGTRTRSDGVISLKRGTAHIALSSGADIVPVHIAGNDKRGLRKRDRIWWLNEDGYYSYRIFSDERVLHMDLYRNGSERENAIRLTGDLESILRERI